MPLRLGVESQPLVFIGTILSQLVNAVTADIDLGAGSHRFPDVYYPAARTALRINIIILSVVILVCPAPSAESGAGSVSHTNLLYNKRGRVPFQPTG